MRMFESVHSIVRRIEEICGVAEGGGWFSFIILLSLGDDP